MKGYIAGFSGGIFGAFITIAVPEPPMLKWGLIIIGCICLGIIIGSWPKRKTQ